MPRILFVSGFHPSTRAKDLAYEFERSVALPFVPSALPHLHIQVRPPRPLRRPRPAQPPRQLQPVSLSPLPFQPPFVALVESPPRSPPVPRNTSPASSSHPRSRPRNRPRAAPRRVESSPESHRAILVAHNHASLRFDSLPSARPAPDQPELNASYAVTPLSSSAPSAMPKMPTTTCTSPT